MRSGFIAIIGLPNAGKSTLLNRLIGEQISIVTPKPQTTRQNIVGIYNAKDVQAVFLDTPGMHESNKAINKMMVDNIGEALADADVVVLLLEPRKHGPNKEDKELFKMACHPERRCEHEILRSAQNDTRKTIIAINKIDTVMDEPRGMVVERYWNAFNPVPCHPRGSKRGSNECSDLGGFPPRSPQGRLNPAGMTNTSTVPVIAISATKGDGCDTLFAKMIEFLPEGEPYYPTDEYTEHPVRFLAGEMVREVATKLLKQELPYSLAVEVEEFKEALSCHPERAPLRGASEGSPERKCENEILRPFRAQNDTKIITRIRANIIVEKESQKAIVIGRGGEMIKKIGTLSREKIEAFVGTKVFLGLQVKVEKDWTKDEKALKRIFNK